MVLAAGLGTRMAPLTRLRPKPALPVLNKPLIAHTLDHLAAHGVTRAVINTHAMPDRIEEAVGRWCPEGLRVVFSHEKEILGTAGGLRRAARHFPDEPLYMVNSDSLSDVDLRAAADAHAASGRRATMVVRPHEEGTPYRPVITGPDQGGTAPLLGFTGRGDAAPGTPRTFTGVHVMQPDVLEEIPARGACDINADVYARILRDRPGALGTWLHEGWWFEAGSPARYLDLNLEMIARAGCTSVVGPGFFLDEEARVTSSCIGSEARLERQAVVDRSVLWRGVTVPPGTRVTHCIVTQDVALPADTTFEESIIMPDEDGDGVQVTPIARPS